MKQMNIINTCNKIKFVFADGFSLELWRKYAEEISKELPSKCEKDGVGKNRHHKFFLAKPIDISFESSIIILSVTTRSTYKILR